MVGGVVDDVEVFYEDVEVVEYFGVFGIICL